MIDWLFDTFIWTAALIALVLVLRRPVARYFGATTAYALWAIPFLRLLLPAVELPAWMNPNPVVAEPADSVATYYLVEPIVAGPIEPVSFFESLPLTQITLVLWLGGAAVFMFLRFRAYHRVRDDLLVEARGVGQVGKVRLIETPATVSPLALGVRDKIVALPEGFMARYDREARDLALAHELAHHQGHDLLVNMLVQPLFALHWFNPLARIGWLAMRRDQEAACDARVVRAHGPAQRASYANLIASFAAGPKVALAAPMACPVLGDKSIIQRLRSLKMNDVSQRRRIAGRGLLVAALIALPLTASISYAEPAAPAAPVPPAPPAAPLAPEAPLAPLAPMALQAAADVAEAPEAKKEVRRIVIHEKDGEHGDDGEVRHVRKYSIIRDGEELSKEEHEELMKELREDMVEMRVELKEAMKGHRMAMVELEHLGDDMPQVSIECSDDKAVKTEDAKGHRVMKICTSQIMASALTGLEQARAQIARNKDLSDEIRKEVLQSLDEEIERMKEAKDD